MWADFIDAVNFMFFANDMWVMWSIFIVVLIIIISIGKNK